MRFLRLGLEDPVPDATTIWLYREQLVQAAAIEALFAAFHGYLEKRHSPAPQASPGAEPSVWTTGCAAGRRSYGTVRRSARPKNPYDVNAQVRCQIPSPIRAKFEKYGFPRPNKRVKSTL